MLVELDALKEQLSGTAVSDEINRKIARARSRVSESVSETGSDSVSLSLQRQKSIESSTPRGLRKRSSSIEESKKLPPAKPDKLIEIEKAETGSVKWSVYKHYLKSIGLFLTIATIFLNMLFQGFSIGSNVWLGMYQKLLKIIKQGTLIVITLKWIFFLG